MGSLQAMRKRMPLLVFILLAVVCLLMLGLACACAADHSNQGLDRALSAVPTAPPVVEVWSFALFVLLGAMVVRRAHEQSRLTPVQLQRLTL